MRRKDRFVLFRQGNVMTGADRTDVHVPQPAPESVKKLRRQRHTWIDLVSVRDIENEPSLR